MHTARQGHASIARGPCIYSFGGYNNGTTLRSAEMYDLRKGKSEPLNNMESARWGFSVWESNNVRSTGCNSQLINNAEFLCVWWRR